MGGEVGRADRILLVVVAGETGIVDFGVRHT